MAVGVLGAFWVVSKALGAGISAGALIVKTDLIVETTNLALKKIEDIDPTKISTSLKELISNDNTMSCGIILKDQSLLHKVAAAINESPLDVSVLRLNEAKAILSSPDTLDKFDIILSGEKHDVMDIQNQLRGEITDSRSIKGSMPVNSSSAKAVRALRKFSARFK